MLACRNVPANDPEPPPIVAFLRGSRNQLGMDKAIRAATTEPGEVRERHGPGHYFACRAGAIGRLDIDTAVRVQAKSRDIAVSPPGSPQFEAGQGPPPELGKDAQLPGDRQLAKQQGAG